MQSEDVDLRGFCAVPWVEVFLISNGILRTCCYSNATLGNWQREDLKEIWHNESYQNFRRHIINGNFPDDGCKICYYNSGGQSLYNLMIGPFEQNMEVVFGFFNKEIPDLSELEFQFHLKSATSNTADILNRYFSKIDELKTRATSYPREVRLALKKLIVIGSVTKAYLEKDLTPSAVAPFRLPQLMTRCNARCIHCTAMHAKEISKNNMLGEEYIERAFSYHEDIINFIWGGSELLLYKGWKTIADNLQYNGVKIILFTNGILLIPSNIRYLIDKEIVHYLNVSMDGATRETVESIRVNVKFDKLIENISYLFHYASEKQYRFTISFSFALMKRNYREFPGLIRLVDRIKSKTDWLNVEIGCQALQNHANAEYKNIVHKEHHTLIDKADLIATFEEALKESKISNIPVNVFSSYSLENFLKEGCPFPPLTISKPKAISKSEVTRLADTSPTLQPQAILDSLDNVAAINANANVTIAPILSIPLEDQGKSAEIYAVIVIDNDVYFATQGGPLGSVNWVSRSGPVDKLVVRNEIPYFAHVTLSELQPFNIGLHNIDLSGFYGIADIYIGYITVMPRSSIIGAAYRLIVESKIPKLTDTSPTLKPQATLKPQGNAATISANANVTIAPVLSVPLEDQGKSAEIYAVIPMDNDVYVATPGGLFGSVNWVSRSGPLEKLVAGNEITSFAHVTLSELQSFNLGLNSIKINEFPLGMHNINLSEFNANIDIYYGYSTSTVRHLSSFVGASYRLIVEKQEN